MSAANPVASSSIPRDAVRALIRRLYTAHAPKGGASAGGKSYTGGEFVPNDASGGGGSGDTEGDDTDTHDEYEGEDEGVDEDEDQEETEEEQQERIRKALEDKAKLIKELNIDSYREIGQRPKSPKVTPKEYQKANNRVDAALSEANRPDRQDLDLVIKGQSYIASRDVRDSRNQPDFGRGYLVLVGNGHIGTAYDFDFQPKWERDPRVWTILRAFDTSGKEIPVPDVHPIDKLKDNSDSYWMRNQYAFRGLLRRVMYARAQSLKAGPSGRLASSRSKTGDPKCSAAASKLALRTATSDDQVQLARCRAMSKGQRSAVLQRAAGHEAKARHLEHRAKSGVEGGAVTGPERRAKAVELMAARRAEIMDPNSARNDREYEANRVRAKARTQAKRAGTIRSKKEADARVEEHLNESAEAKADRISRAPVHLHDSSVDRAAKLAHADRLDAADARAFDRKMDARSAKEVRTHGRELTVPERLARNRAASGVHAQRSAGGDYEGKRVAQTPAAEKLTGARERLAERVKRNEAKVSAPMTQKEEVKTPLSKRDQINARRDALHAANQEAGKDARSMLLGNDDTTGINKLMVHPSVHEKGRWQLSRIDYTGEPAGHATFDTKEDAIRSASGISSATGSPGIGNGSFRVLETKGNPVVPPVKQVEESPDVSRQPKGVAARYPITDDFASGQHDRLAERMERIAAKHIKADPKLSSNRAKEIAAAKIVNRYRAEQRHIEDFVKDNDIPEVNDFYDKHVEAQEKSNLNGILQRLSGSRAMIVDTEDYPVNPGKGMRAASASKTAPAVSAPVTQKEQEAAPPTSTAPAPSTQLKPASELPPEGREFAADIAKRAEALKQRLRQARHMAMTEEGRSATPHVDRSTLDAQRKQLGITPAEVKGVRVGLAELRSEASEHGFDPKDVASTAGKEARQEIRDFEAQRTSMLGRGQGYYPSPGERIAKRKADPAAQSEADRKWLESQAAFQAAQPVAPTPAPGSYEEAAKHIKLGPSGYEDHAGFAPSLYRTHREAVEASLRVRQREAEAAAARKAEADAKQAATEARTRGRRSVGLGSKAQSRYHDAAMKNVIAHGFKKGKISIVKGDRSGKSSHKEDVEGQIKGNIGIHKTETGGYMVTHLGSGMGIGRADTMNRAKEVANAIHRRGIDLDQMVAAKGKYSPEQKKHLKFMKAISGARSAAYR